MNIEALKEMKLHELMKAAGGTADDPADIDEALDEATEILNAYMSSLLVKYHCTDQDDDCLMSRLTPEEKDKIKELKTNIFNVLRPAV